MVAPVVEHLWQCFKFHETTVGGDSEGVSFSFGGLKCTPDKISCGNPTLEHKIKGGNHFASNPVSFHAAHFPFDSEFGGQ